MSAALARIALLCPRWTMAGKARWQGAAGLTKFEFLRDVNAVVSCMLAEACRRAIATVKVRGLGWAARLGSAGASAPIGVEQISVTEDWRFRQFNLYD